VKTLSAIATSQRKQRNIAEATSLKITHIHFCKVPAPYRSISGPPLTRFVPDHSPSPISSHGLKMVQVLGPVAQCCRPIFLPAPCRNRVALTIENRSAAPFDLRHEITLAFLGE
jgi:hypothetical protein